MENILLALQKLEKWILERVPKWMKVNDRDMKFVNGIKCGIMFTFLFSSGVGFGIEFKSWKYEGSKGGKFGWLFHKKWKIL